MSMDRRIAARTALASPPCAGPSRIAAPGRAADAIRLMLAAAVAPPIGLLLLGAVFNNTPIELRYLSFGLPFVALLLARIGSHSRGRGMIRR